MQCHMCMNSDELPMGDILKRLLFRMKDTRCSQHKYIDSSDVICVPQKNLEKNISSYNCKVGECVIGIVLVYEL